MPKLGFNARLYYLGSGTRATWGAADSDGVHVGAAPASLAIVSGVRDNTATLEKGEADVTTRDNDGWEATQTTLKKASIEFDLIYDPTKASHKALLKSYLSSTTIAIAALDGDKATAGVEGLWADFVVTTFTKAEQLQEGQSVSVTLKPALSDVPPEWVRTS